jgi:hypothetical protein
MPRTLTSLVVATAMVSGLSLAVGADLSRLTTRREPHAADGDARLRVILETDAGVQLVLRIRDDGQPPLCSYRRAVISVKPL